MAERRFRERIASALGVRAGEGGAALLFFFYFFFVTAPFTIVKSVRDASYLDDIGVRHLPWAYATAVLVAGAVAVHARLQARTSRRSLLIGSLLAFAAAALVFRALFGLEWKGIVLLYWLWAGIFVVILTTQFWFLINDVYDPREAKRLIGFVGSGGILGGIAGGILTRFLARPGRPEDLLFAVAGLLAAGALVVAFLFRRLERGPHAGRMRAAAARPAAKAGFADSLATVRRDHYLRLLAWLALLVGIVSTFVDWQSKAVIDSVPAAKANLASFFGLFNAGLLGLAFLFQLVLTSRFLSRFGLRLGLMVYPLVLLAGSAGVAVWPVLGWAVAVKGVDKAFSYSIHQSSRELLYIPVSPDVKYRAKAFIDMFLNRFSKTIGAILLLLLFLLPPGNDILLVSISSTVLIAAWAVVNLRLGRTYAREVRLRLDEKWSRGESLVAASADAETAKMLVDALESRRQSPSLYALHLYEMALEGKMNPALLRLLSESDKAPSPAGLPLLDGEETPWIPAVEVDLVEAAPDIKEIFALPAYQKVMGDYAAKVLRGGGEEDSVSRMELAKAAGLMDARSRVAAALDELLQDASPDVVHYAADAAAKLRRREAVPWLVRKLLDPRSRGDAASALSQYGAAIAGTLADRLLDPEETADVKKRIAAVLAGSPAQDAADALLDALAAPDAGIDHELIDALDAIREQAPAVVFDETVVRAAVEREIRRLAAATALADGRWLFHLLGLFLPHEEMARAGQNFVRGTKDAKAFALELLDAVLPSDLKERVVPALDRLSRAGGEG